MNATDKVFPMHVGEYQNTEYGIDVRDYIAIQVVVGLSANPGCNVRDFEDIADMAYKQADAMIKRSEVKDECKSI